MLPLTAFIRYLKGTRASDYWRRSTLGVAEEDANVVGDRLNLDFRQFAEHRKGEDFVRRCRRMRKLTIAMTKIFVCFEMRKRNRVVDSRLNAMLAQKPLQAISLHGWN